MKPGDICFGGIGYPADRVVSLGIVLRTAGTPRSSRHCERLVTTVGCLWTPSQVRVTYRQPTCEGFSMMDHSRSDAETGDDVQSNANHDSAKMEAKAYLRFAAMIATAMVVMYAVMFVSSWEWSHVRLSESRIFMAVTMGGTMGLVMLVWMLNMFRNLVANIGVVLVSVSLIGIGVFLDRSQATVGDVSFMNSMIPHHSMAITRAERFNVTDVRVCELAVAISEAQRREILEMDWLIDDIEQNGPASTPEEAEARTVPHFEEPADRQCP
jgi:ABC-type multidrug transport system fused ATPase/permease subunit